MRYKGPAKPTHREIISDQVELVIFLLLAIYMVAFLFWEA